MRRSGTIHEAISASIEDEGAADSAVVNEDINKLLIYRFGQIGDTIVALPSLWMLRSRFPQARYGSNG